MAIIYRQKPPFALTPEQQQLKLQEDSKYEIAVQNLSTAFYTKKRSVGVSAEEEADYQTQHSKLWDDYLEWAKANGLYEEVTPEQQLAEAEDALNLQLEAVNLIRTELGLKAVQITEVKAV